MITDTPGYRRLLKTGLVQALKDTFDGNYPDPTLRDIHVSIEYPIEAQQYPSIWVNYEDASLQTAGIDHQEIDDAYNIVLRWRFQGYATYTIVAFSSHERDRIYDEMVKIIAFARSSSTAGKFRQTIENNEYLAMNFDFDQIEIRGDFANPGTPWETDEIIYEITIAMQVLGEFVASVDTGSLVRLSQIIVDNRVIPSPVEMPVAPARVSITHNRAPFVYDPANP